MSAAPQETRLATADFALVAISTLSTEAVLHDDSLSCGVDLGRG